MPCVRFLQQQLDLAAQLGDC